MVKIEITIDGCVYEYYNVPIKIANALITILDECEKEESDIVSAVSEVE